MRLLDKINKIVETNVKYYEKLKRINLKLLYDLRTYIKVSYFRSCIKNTKYGNILTIYNYRPENIDRSVYNLLTDAEMDNKRELLRNKQLSEKEKLIFIEELKQVSLFNKRLHLNYSIEKASKLIGKKWEKKEEIKYIEYKKQISVYYNISMKEAEKYCFGVFNVEDYLKDLI